MVTKAKNIVVCKMVFMCFQKSAFSNALVKQKSSSNPGDKEAQQDQRLWTQLYLDFPKQVTELMLLSLV